MRIKIYGRLAFAKINKPERVQGEGNPRYSSSLIMEPDSKSVKKVEKAMLAVANAKWGEAKGKDMVTTLTRQLRVCMIEGDTKPDVSGYEGNMVLNAGSPENTPPTLVQTIDGVNVRLDNATQSVIYSGCYVNMIVELWAQDNQYGRRINAQLSGIQFVKDGEAFAGGRPASEDDFEVIEEDDDDEVSFD